MVSIIQMQMYNNEIVSYEREKRIYSDLIQFIPITLAIFWSLDSFCGLPLSSLVLSNELTEDWTSLNPLINDEDGDIEFVLPFPFCPWFIWWTSVEIHAKQMLKEV